MLQIDVAHPPTLLTERLLLRELSALDAPAIAAGAGDRRVSRFLVGVPSPYSLALARRWIAARVDWWTLGRGVTYAIARRELEGALLGTISLRHYPRDRRAELGYWLASDAWGRGIATEAARALIEHGFRAFSLARVYAQVMAGNDASVRVLEKLGMVREGVKRQHVRKDRRLHDVALYGLLRAEWPSLLPEL